MNNYIYIMLNHNIFNLSRVIFSNNIFTY